MISNNLLKKVILEKAISGQLIKNNNGSWKEELLGNIGDWKAGSTPSKDKNEYHIDGTIPWLLTGDLNDGDIYSVNHYITDLAYKECSLRLNPVNSVLIAMYGATIGKVAINKIETTTNQACCACICDEKKIYYKYLFYYLIAIRDNLKSKAEGAGQPNISKQKICNTKIMLPSLEEQYMIVEKIEEIFELIDKKEKNDQEKTKLKEMLKQMIIDLATSGKLFIKSERNIDLDMPEGWEYKTLGELAKTNDTRSFADGPFGSNLKTIHYISEPEVRIIQLGNMTENGWNNKNVKYTSYEHLKEISRCEVQPGDIVITKMMPAGLPIIMPDLGTKITLGTDVVKFVPSDEVNKKYIYYAMKSNLFVNQVYAETHGITRVRTSLNKLKTYRILMPKRDVQDMIVEKIENVLELIEQL